jgi:hypothetical protein
MELFCETEINGTRIIFANSLFSTASFTTYTLMPLCSVCWHDISRYVLSNQIPHLLVPKLDRFCFSTFIQPICLDNGTLCTVSINYELLHFVVIHFVVCVLAWKIFVDTLCPQLHFNSVLFVYVQFMPHLSVITNVLFTQIYIRFLDFFVSFSLTFASLFLSSFLLYSMQRWRETSPVGT